MKRTIVTAPTLEPIPIDDAKLYMREDGTDQDALIEHMIKGARRRAEDFLGRALIQQTWDFYLDDFPDTDYIELPLPPLSSITSIKYQDDDDAEQTLSTDYYYIDTKSEPGRACLVYGESWPSTYDEYNVVVVRFVAGYGTQPSSVPEDIREGIRLAISDVYETRQSYMTGTMATRVVKPEDYWWPYRVVPV